MADKEQEQLKEILDIVFENIDYYDGSPRKQIEEAIVAKLKALYPIMYEEEAEFVGWFIDKGWIPPEEAKMLYVKWNKEEVARKLWYFRTGAVMSKDDHPSPELLSQADQLKEILTGGD